MRQPPRPPTMRGQVFADACAAADALLKGTRQSGQVAIEMVEGRAVVFLNGRQACPDRHQGPSSGLNVFRRTDGALAVMGYNGARFGNSCPRPCSAAAAKDMQQRWTGYLLLPLEKGGLYRVDLPPVDPVPAETPNSEFYLDARGRLWVGTNRDGLYMFDGRHWNRFAEEARLHPDNVIEMVTEDAAGNIWVGSFPQFNRARGKYLNPNLHRWNGKEWKHWSPDEGLGYWSTECILALRSGALIVGTNGGLSRLEGDRVGTVGAAPTRVTAKSLSEDVHGRLWITHMYSGTGVTVFDGSEYTARDSRDGLFADRLRDSAHDGEGRVWLLADDGRVAVYDPRQFLSPDGPITAEKEPGK